MCKMIVYESKSGMRVRCECAQSPHAQLIKVSYFPASHPFHTV